jgi:cyanate permease
MTRQKSLVYGVLLLMGGALLIVTVVVMGCLLPSNISTKFHNRVVTAHNAALAIAYVVTGVVQIAKFRRNAACISVGK